MTNRIREWRQTRGWSLQQLADASGTSKSQIDKLEKGDRRLTVDWMVRLAKPLGCDPRDLMREAPNANQNFQPVRFAAASSAAEALIPVRGAARGGTQQQMFLGDGAIDHVPRPYYLSHTKDAYALYVVGSSMAPMYRPRQLLFVNPYKPPAPGAGVVVIQKNDAVLIKEFVRQRKTGVVLREYQPEMREFTVPQEDIAALHVVVGAAEPQ